ncbi:pentatricopeptide repeat domain-containing protein [Colletotrichum musicola]|uniref:Pentatricopeptide repeat domain-containing protein n=1 Tax=Colletotrichum musicola TaxID=2175873 RepID=A0A8H6U6I9_9PEZI|nr:pentatricopeptide repeat domain-containing protein [Colletotrichum musicola]
MSHRALFRDITCRNSFICQSCRSAAGSPATPLPWTVRHSSRVVQLGARPRSGTKNAQKSESSPQTDSKPSSAAAALLKELTAKRTGEPTVRFFEKSDSGQVQQLSGEDAYSDSFGGIKEMEQDFKENFASDVKSTLLRLKEEAGLEAYGVGVESIAKDFEQQLGGAETPEEMMECLDAYIKDLERQLEEKGFDVSEFDDSNPMATMGFIEEATTNENVKRKRGPIPQIPENMWSFNQRKRITRLNTLLSRTAKELRRGEELTAKTVQSIWKAYSAARQSLSKSWADVPQDVWDLLWQVLSTSEVHNKNRLAHLSLLARDMSEAKVALSPSQQLVTMESMFMDGWEEKAIENWKRCMPSLGDDGAETFREFWELGVRMFCQKGDLVQAERAVNKLLERQRDPRVLMPFIRACAAEPAEESGERAWDAYRRMRDLLGPSMGLEDYDQVISFFLTTNQTDRALYAFVDMMTSGTVDLRGRDTLPSQIGNKFFFGKWLKRLIGAGDLDGAHSVFTFMRSKGIVAAAIQINGLIGAWQRTGVADHLEKADSLAWDMINARLEFVNNRKRLAGLDGPARLVQIAGRKDEPGAMPKATLETFSLLAENYRLRQLPDNMAKLWDAFREAEISPDAFMMNQLIESVSQSGNITEARELYRTLVYERQVRPDPYTFMAMWKMLGINRLHIVEGDQLTSEVGLTRQTFAEMVRFTHVFQKDGLDGQLARKILHTFRRLKDHIGLIMALRTFKVVFNYTPPEVLALEMLMGTTNLSWDTASARQKLRLVKRKMDEFVEERSRQLGRSETLEEMTPQERGDELLEYLQTHYLHEAGAVPEGLAEEVATEMGVYDVLGSQD